MSSRLVRVATALYPRAWRRRYAEELSDLCEELAAAGEATPTRLGLGLLPHALAERSRAVRPRALLAAAAATLAVAGAAALSGGFGLAGPGAGGGAARTGAAWLAPHSSRDSRLVQLTAGRAEATTTLAEPGGYLLLARVSAPAGMRVEVQATQLIPDAFSAVVSTFRLSPLDSFLSCRVRAGSSTCTQGGQEFCPLFSSAWRVHVVKEGGPSGPVQVDLVVGQRPVGLSVAQTDTWVARYDSAWTGRAAPS